jgi:hypothetical protein
MVFITFLVSATKSNALYPTSDMVCDSGPSSALLTDPLHSKTLQATGIAFNVILVRSSARRDQQFTVFDKHERTLTVPESDQGTVGNKTIGSIKFIPAHGSQPVDVEMAVKYDHNADKRSSRDESDLYPGGIKITKSVVHS